MSKKRTKLALLAGLGACGAAACLYILMDDYSTDEGGLASPTKAQQGAIDPKMLPPPMPDYEVRSTSAAPEPFQRARYEVNRDRYLARVVPDRAFQLAKPGPGVPMMRHATDIFHRVEERSSVNLAVRVPRGSPVTFTSKGGGEFSNGHSSITVAADETGLARAAYTATPGTVARAEIFAGCPEARGQVVFQVDVVAKGTF